MARRAAGNTRTPRDDAASPISIDAMLVELDRMQLQTIIRRLAVAHPDWLAAVEQQINEVRGSNSARDAHRTLQPSPDTLGVRREMRRLFRAFHSSDPYDGLSWLVDSVRELADRARPYLDQRDGRGALAILETVTQEYLDGWFGLDDSDDEAAALFDDLGTYWAEAILTSDLTDAERQGWAQRLRNWRADIADYGGDTAFNVALEALRNGWEDRRPSPELVLAQLNVLERQGRLDEALRLAESAHMPDRYLSLLVRLDRAQDALDYALGHFTQAHDAFFIARALLEHGATRQALRLAEHALSLEGERWTVARWLRQTAADQGEPELALRAALVVLAELPTLANYQALRSLAGDSWLALREAVLDELRQRSQQSPAAIGEILVHEGLLDEAIALAERVPTAYSLVERVADACIANHSDWVQRMSRQQAERIMNAGDARHYHYAIGWLKRARAAAQVGGSQTEWRQYVDGLLVRHARKYALVPALKQLCK